MGLLGAPLLVTKNGREKRQPLLCLSWRECATTRGGKSMMQMVGGGGGAYGMPHSFFLAVNTLAIDHAFLSTWNTGRGGGYSIPYLGCVVTHVFGGGIAPLARNVHLVSPPAKGRGSLLHLGPHHLDPLLGRLRYLTPNLSPCTCAKQAQAHVGTCALTTHSTQDER